MCLFISKNIPAPVPAQSTCRNSAINIWKSIRKLRFQRCTLSEKKKSYYSKAMLLTHVRYCVFYACYTRFLTLPYALDAACFGSDSALLMQSQMRNLISGRPTGFGWWQMKFLTALKQLRSHSCNILRAKINSYLSNALWAGWGCCMSAPAKIRQDRENNGVSGSLDKWLSVST